MAKLLAQNTLYIINDYNFHTYSYLISIYNFKYIFVTLDISYLLFQHLQIRLGKPMLKVKVLQ